MFGLTLPGIKFKSAFLMADSQSTRSKKVNALNFFRKSFEYPIYEIFGFK